MAELIRYNDGVIIQIAQTDPTKPVAFAGAGTKVGKNFDAVIRVIEPLLKPLNDVMGRTVNQGSVSEAEVKLGFSFSLEGTVYLAKVSGEGNLEVTITYKRKN